MGCFSEMLFEVNTEQISRKNRYNVSVLLVRSKGKNRWKAQRKRAADLGTRLLLM